MPSKLFSRNLQKSNHNHHLQTDKQPSGLEDAKRKKKDSINKNITNTAEEKTHHNHRGRKGTQRARLISSNPNPIFHLLSMQSFPRTGKTEKNLFYLHVIASALVGGTRRSGRRGRRKSERCRKAADSSAFENSLNGGGSKKKKIPFFLPDPNFNHGGWIIHSRPVTCRDGDKESLLYFDSHNKFMTRCLKGGRRGEEMRARGGGRARGEVQVGGARDREDKDETGRSRRGGNRRSRNTDSQMRQDVEGFGDKLLK